MIRWNIGSRLRDRRRRSGADLAVQRGEPPRVGVAGLVRVVDTAEVGSVQVDTNAGSESLVEDQAVAPLSISTSTVVPPGTSSRMNASIAGPFRSTRTGTVKPSRTRRSSAGGCSITTAPRA